jgi:hypothetical protein
MNIVILESAHKHGVQNTEATITQKEVDKIVAQFDQANSQEGSANWHKVRELSSEEKAILTKEYAE